MCLWTYTKKVFVPETNDLSDQNNVKREVNQGQKMFFFGNFVLNVKALSPCPFYTMIKWEHKPTQDAQVSQLLDVEVNLLKTLTAVSVVCFAFLKIIPFMNCSPSEQSECQKSKAALTFSLGLLCYWLVSKVKLAIDEM